MSTSTGYHQYLKSLTSALREVHRHLVEIVKAEYEQDTGSGIDTAHLLQLLTEDAYFDWLHELSEFMVVVDELLDQKDITHEEMAGIHTQAKMLVAPEEGNASKFYHRYVTYLQHQPELTMAHANLRKSLLNS